MHGKPHVNLFTNIVHVPLMVISSFQNFLSAIRMYFSNWQISQHFYTIIRKHHGKIREAGICQILSMAV